MSCLEIQSPYHLILQPILFPSNLKSDESYFIKKYSQNLDCNPQNISPNIRYLSLNHLCIKRCSRNLNLLKHISNSRLIKSPNKI